MRICSFNANGLRSAASKGFFDWFADRAIDLLCVQETKAQEVQLTAAGIGPQGYQGWFHDAEKPGYSGVAIYSRRPADAVLEQLHWAPFDREGRYLEVRFGELSVVSLYLPSGSSGEPRQAFKYQVMAWLQPILERWRVSGRSYVLCGDWNIVRSELDIRNWKSNQNNSGCLADERAWMNQVCQGWIDSYRLLNPQGQDYTWWSQRGAARANNVGWRIDYQLVTPDLGSRLSACRIYSEPKFSDHAPLVVDYRE